MSVFIFFNCNRLSLSQSFKYTFNQPNNYSFVNSCSRRCTPGDTTDENGFKFHTKCSSLNNGFCHIGQGWSHFFYSEDAIMLAGELKKCYSGYIYCKVWLFKKASWPHSLYIRLFQTYYSQLDYECTRNCIETNNTKCIFYNQTECAATNSQLISAFNKSSFALHKKANSIRSSSDKFFLVVLIALVLLIF